MKSSIYTISLLLLCWAVLPAQAVLLPDDYKDISNLKQKEIDKEVINSLSGDGVILVKLNDNNKKISALRKNGLNDKADKLAAEAHEENKQVVDAFKEHFDYCQYYFYYARDTEKVIKQKDFSQLYTDLENTVSAEITDPPALLFYKTVRHLRKNDSYKFVLMHWDYEKVTQLEGVQLFSLGWTLRQKSISDKVKIVNSKLHDKQI